MRLQFHDRPGPRWQLVAVFVLVVLLTTLGTFQYRWLGEVSEAERARMRESLHTRAADFTQEFDRELTRIYLAFHFEPDAFEKNPASAVSASLVKAQASASVPGLIKDVFLLEAQGQRANVLQRLDPGTQTLAPAQWPQPLDAWRRRAAHVAPLGPAALLPIFMTDAVDAAAPALIIPVPRVRKIENGAGRLAVVPDPDGVARALVVWLDADRLQQQLLAPLVAKYFGTGDASEYLVSIVQRDDPSRVVYASAKDAVVDERSADVSTGMFDLRMNEMTRLTGGAKVTLRPGSSGSPAAERLAITIVRRSASAADGPRVMMTGGDDQGAWQVRARYRSGSLESIVASSRRRNLAISLGVLGLLGAAFILVMAASQRQRRLAQQQMEFVASVSHELRTPLAVICSAGENLADGVVSDGAQVKTYGALIETEGRRLGDMVERVLQFSGIRSGAQTRACAEVDVAQVIADAVNGVVADARDRGVGVTVHPHGALPPISGDADALRSAVQNIVGNAVKYSPSGSSVEVTTELLEGVVVRIRVVDRGIGIDAGDLPHIFQPFYRGRRAVEAQVRGSGIGLSVVRHVIQAHGGDVRIESGVGEGTTVTIVLPGASDQSDGRGRVIRLRRQRAGAAS